MSELRKDPVVNRWVITLDDKNFVPQPEYKLPSVIPDAEEACPFCPGNEDKTAGPILLVEDTGGSWSVRVIPNNNPYLKVETELRKKGLGIFDYITGTGANEVIIESPSHSMDIDRLDQAHVAAIMRVYRDRMLDLSKDTRLEYHMVFKNRGAKAGATIIHPHSQLMGLPIVPLRIAEEIEGAEDYFSFKKRCVYCDILENELGMNSRVIKETEHFVSIAPYASRTCFEMWVLPKRHMAHYTNISEAEINGLGLIMKDSISRLNRALGSPSYNYMLHTAPVKAGELEHYHWHVEILPRVKAMAGLEWGSGMDINPTLPEEAAAYLKNL
jgi:UDPglucose--hexose-1-phosphate uridylyltransferase